MSIDLPEIKPGYLYTITLEDASSAQGGPLMGNVLRYNVVKAVTQE